MPSVALVSAAWAGLCLLALIFYANALGVVDQSGACREIIAAGASEGVARRAVLAGRALQLVAATGLFFTPTRPWAALALAGFLVVATLTAHAFWRAAPASRGSQFTGFLKNTALIGGLLIAGTWRVSP